MILVRHTIFLLLNLILISCAGPQRQAEQSLQFNTPPSDANINAYISTANAGMASSDKPFVAQAGINILQKNGNAIDAAIAMSFVVSVIAPQSTGLGGGGFLLFYNANTQKIHSFDFRERAPLKATHDMYMKKNIGKKASLQGALAVGVPGIVAGLLELHKKYGRLPLKTVMARAIELADKGFTVYGHLAEALQEQQKLLARSSSMRKIFFKKGRPLKKGERLVQKDLARTLGLILKKGKKGFYKGSVAASILKETRRLGGIISEKDFSHYKVIERKPIWGQYRGYMVASVPPPSSGGVHIAQMLNMLEPSSFQSHTPQSANYVHLLSEVMRRAYKDRARFLGDPDFVDIPVNGLISKKYGKELLKSIQPNKATISEQMQELDPSVYESPSTSHLNVVDSMGNAISSTQSVNYYFGSGVMAPGTGVVLNNTMDDFSKAPGVPNKYGLVGSQANAIAAGKTPLSSMSPTIVLKDGKPWLVLGAPGGSQIITAILQVILHRIDFDLPLGKAVALKRIHHQYLPDKIRFDDNAFSTRTEKDLQKKGHILWEKLLDAKVSAIEVMPHGFLGAVDPKSYGEAVGFSHAP